jgi:predicted dehydrogenase
MQLERGNLSRRGFMQRSLAGLAGAGIPVWFGKDLVAAAEQAQAQAQNVSGTNTIKVGLIGCGGQGNDDAGTNLRNARGMARIPGVRFVACCDVDRERRETFARSIHPGETLPHTGDFRELLARQDVDAVLIATPDHWHALTAIAAMRAGKDVYCEKPLTLTVEEGKALVRVARATNKRLQTGSQQRTEFNGRFRMAAELVRNGRVGRVRSIECRVGDNPLGGPFQVTQPPAALDWDFWMGPTPRCDYVREKCHYTFRWWYEYSGGKMTDWGAHHLDSAQWILNMDTGGPTEVEATSEPPRAQPNCYTCHPHFVVTYKYPGDVTVRCQSRGENGLRIEGEDGKWIFVARNKLEASDPRIISEPLPANAIRLPVHLFQTRNFIECVRNRQQPICNVEVGHRSCTVCHIGNIAIRTGQRLHWDAEHERFVDNAAANQMLGREMRAPWRLDA